VLGAQLLFGALFGLMGLALADPIIAMIKTALERKSVEDEGAAPTSAGAAPSQA
jgi:predicted PurR-regulated permease PerM